MAFNFKKSAGFWQGLVGFYGLSLFVILPLGITLNKNKRLKENPRPIPNDDIAMEVYKLRLQARQLSPSKTED